MWRPRLASAWSARHRSLLRNGEARGSFRRSSRAPAHETGKPRGGSLVSWPVSLGLMDKVPGERQASLRAEEPLGLPGVGFLAPGQTQMEVTPPPPLSLLPVYKVPLKQADLAEAQSVTWTPPGLSRPQGSGGLRWPGLCLAGCSPPGL